ncbi:zinc-ribbon domain-containing protein [Lysinibacillus sp. NPDC086135]|uniref:zinc-ribbon domain-containing protein n=1 Tax=Lysinibacillus sp. NPDC086135 TaxID=3364130 RepID=UPI003803FC71
MCKNTYVNIQTGEILDMERIVNLKDNTMLKHSPHLFEEWDFEENDADIYKVTKGSKMKFNFICKQCKSKHIAMPTNKIRSKMCIYCRGLKVNETNSLASLNPDLAEQWHPTLNGELTPRDVTCGYDKKVWWLGECGHEWDMRVVDRTKGSNCPICANKRIIVNENDLWTTHPHVAVLLKDDSLGYKYHHGSTFCTDWICSNCGLEIKNKEIRVIVKKGLPCINCSDGFSLPEKMMSATLSQLDVNFTSQKSFSWSNNKRYDFYIPTLNMIIETHGAQHSINPYKNGRSLQEEQFNDEFKRNVAIQNKIINYIEIDCRVNDFDYIKKSILNSVMTDFFNLRNVNWDKVYKKSFNSMVNEVCDIYKRTELTHTEISKKLAISSSTVIRYLKIGAKMGIVEYAPHGEKGARSSGKLNKKKVVQIKDSSLIKVWESIEEASKAMCLKSSSSISIACKNANRTARGFKWSFLEDYEKQYGKL